MSDERPEPDYEGESNAAEVGAMWVYKRVAAAGAQPAYQVGFYAPNGEWVSDSDYVTQAEASKRVNYLNGGNRSVTNDVHEAAKRGYSGK